MIGRGRWSTRNCARSLNLTIWINGICTTKNPFRRMRRTSFWDFEIQTDYLISARRPNLCCITEKIQHLCIKYCLLLLFNTPKKNGGVEQKRLEDMWTARIGTTGSDFRWTSSSLDHLCGHTSLQHIPHANSRGHTSSSYIISCGYASIQYAPHAIKAAFPPRTPASYLL